MDTPNGSDADQSQDSCAFQSQNSFTGYDDSLFSYYGISQPATLDTNDKENYNSENTLEPISHSLDVSAPKLPMQTRSSSDLKKSFYEAVVSNSTATLKSSSGSTDQFDSFFASKMTDIVKSNNNEPIIKPKSTEQRQQSPAKSSEAKIATTSVTPFINTFKMPETNNKPTKNESEEMDYNNIREEPKKKPKATNVPVSIEAEATNEKFNKLFNKSSSNMSDDLTSSLLIPTCFDDQSSSSTPGFNFAALNNDKMQVEDEVDEVEHNNAGEDEDPTKKPDTLLSENELELKYRTTVNRKRKRDDVVQEKDEFANDQFKELDDVHSKRRKLDTSNYMKIAVNTEDKSIFSRAKRNNFVKMNLKQNHKGGKYGNKTISGRWVKSGPMKVLHQGTYGDPKDNADEAALFQLEDLSSTTNTMDNFIDSIAKSELEGLDPNEIFADCSDVDTSSEHLRATLKTKFGHEEFREGQEETIRRVLQGKNTLVVIPTGSGKSLCYQIPALLMDRLTIVISPLLALMIDQLKNLPECLPGGCINSQQSTTEFRQTVDDLRQNKLRVLFVSPEKLCSDKFVNLLRSLKIPFGFACIDEAHCVSEWSHNFRPSYLRLQHVLQSKLGIKTILAMTATATKRTEVSICQSLNIPFEGVVRCSVIRPNLHLNASLAEDRHLELVKLLNAKPFSEFNSIIIYCMLQRETDELAGYLQMKGFDAASYHAGKTSKDRKRVQDQFTKNKVRIIVATVAFGMGLDKPDVRGVIHFSLPKSPENYIQEVGRAGRDGQPAHCHLFLNMNDYITMRSLAHTDSTDRIVIKKFVQSLLGSTKESLEDEPESDPANSKRFRFDEERDPLPAQVQGNFVCLPIEPLEQKLDLKRAVISTFFTWLEIEGIVQILPQMFGTCQLTFYNITPEVLRARNKLIASILHYGKKTNGQIEFSLNLLARKYNTTISEILSSLDKLEEKGEIKYQVKEKAFYMRMLHSYQDEEMDRLIDRLYTKVMDLERTTLHKIDIISNIMKQHCAQEEKQVEFLHSKINEYFITEDETTLLPPKTEDVDRATKNKTFLQADIRVFLERRGDTIASGRQVARIFHGISSPCFPAVDWCMDPHWHKYKEYDFNEIMQIAAAELRRLNTSM